MENVEVARRLEEVADLLKAQRANSYRVQAYRRAAGSVRHLPEALTRIWRERGDEGLRAVTGAGEPMAVTFRTTARRGALTGKPIVRGRERV